MNTDVNALFERKASKWSEKYADNGPLLQRLSAFSASLTALAPPPATVLDFGCGTGELARHLDTQGYHVTGCDFAEGMVQHAEREDKHGRVQWHLLPSDWRELPFPAHSFDVVVASSVLEYIDNVDYLFRQLVHVIFPGGLLVATVPNVEAVVRRLEAVVRPLVCALPSLRWLPADSRLANYVTYLRISRNRFSIAGWRSVAEGAGFFGPALDSGQVAIPAPIPETLTMIALRTPT